MFATISAEESDFTRKQVSIHGGDRALISCIVSRAIVDLENADRHIREDAREWIFSEAKGEHSFLWALSHLELPVCVVRKRARAVMKLMESQPADAPETRGLSKLGRKKLLGLHDQFQEKR